jgi:murein DD-endopeptidase MepM/ murein hydrolase activator NlpD
MFDLPIFAAADGVVIYVGHEVPGMGNVLLIYDCDGSISGYGNCEEVAVDVGEWVDKGDVIAYALPDRAKYAKIPSGVANHDLAEYPLSKNAMNGGSRGAK